MENQSSQLTANHSPDEPLIQQPRISISKALSFTPPPPSPPPPPTTTPTPNPTPNSHPAAPLQELLHQRERNVDLAKGDVSGYTEPTRYADPFKEPKPAQPIHELDYYLMERLKGLPEHMARQGPWPKDRQVYHRLPNYITMPLDNKSPGLNWDNSCSNDVHFYALPREHTNDVLQAVSLRR